MKTKQLLFLLAFALLIFSCKKNDDYRDAYEGVYNASVIGFINYVNTDLGIFLTQTIKEQTSIIVRKLSGRELTISIEGGTMTALVDENGKLTIPSESGTFTEIDPDTGVPITTNITVTYSGVITGKTISIEESYSGTASFPESGKTINLNISGNVVYSGTK